MRARGMTQAHWTRRMPAGTRDRPLADLDSHMLCDIGLSPADAQIECAKPFWRD
jgi:uncharacterized protein YjiS (DUF1127 family)